MEKSNIQTTIEKKENGGDTYTLFWESILTELNNIPDGANKKEMLLKNLVENYGKDFALEIMNSLPEDIFNTKKPDKNVEKNLEDKIQKKYNLPKEKIEELKKNPNWQKLLGLGMLAPVAISAFLGISELKKSKENNNETETELTTNQNETEVKKINRFDQEVYNYLPEKAKEIYKYMADEDPTPGRFYGILDKDNALIYLFDSQNNLVNKIIAGFGKDEGDEKNTSEELHKGIRTTPAGVCLVSNYMTEEDKNLYGRYQFSLFGKTIIGEDEELGIHQTYLGEFEPRTQKLNTPDPNDNRFSDGCINIDSNDFKSYVSKNFKGDYGELFFIMPDKKSGKDGNIFDVNLLIQSICPTIIEMANEEMTLYSEHFSGIKISIIDETNNIKILENKHQRLVDEYKKDPKNASKQKEIENIKNEINDRKNSVGELRKNLSDYENKMKESVKKRDRAQELLMKK